jgi:hypothetical protein
MDRFDPINGHVQKSPVATWWDPETVISDEDV